jgi:hypothetical protein
MNIPMILISKYPDSEWSLDGEEYSGLNWISDTEKPTEEELIDLWPEVNFENEYKKIELKRFEQYRLTSDPIFFKWQRGDATENDWLQSIDEIKLANPYPTR